MINRQIFSHEYAYIYVYNNDVVEYLSHPEVGEAEYQDNKEDEE